MIVQLPRQVARCHVARLTEHSITIAVQARADGHLGPGRGRLRHRRQLDLLGGRRPQPSALRIVGVTRPLHPVAVGLLEHLVVVARLRPALAKIGADNAAANAGDDRARPCLRAHQQAVAKTGRHAAGNAAHVATDKMGGGGLGAQVVTLAAQFDHLVSAAGEVIGHQRDASRTGPLEHHPATGAQAPCQHRIRCGLRRGFGTGQLRRFHRRWTARCTGLAGRTRRRAGRLHQQARGQPATGCAPRGAGSRHLIEAERLECVHRLVEQGPAHRVVAFDQRQVGAHLLHADDLPAVAACGLGDAPLQLLELGGGLTGKGQRVIAKGAYRVAVDYRIRMFERGAQLEVAETTPRRCILDECHDRTAGSNRILEVFRATCIPHHVLQRAGVVRCARLVAMKFHEMLELAFHHPELGSRCRLRAQLVDEAAPRRITDDAGLLADIANIRLRILEVRHALAVYAGKADVVHVGRQPWRVRPHLPRKVVRIAGRSIRTRPG